MSDLGRGSGAGERRLAPLTALRTGQSGTVARLGGGRAMQARLLGMGLCIGREVSVLAAQNGSRGPTLVAVGETRLAIGHGMAERIMVRVGEG